MSIFNAYPSKRGLAKTADYSTGRVVLNNTTGKWKADKDCWITYSLTKSNTPSKLFVNGKLVVSAGTGAGTLQSGFPGIYINKGDTVEVTDHFGTVTAYYCR